MSDSSGRISCGGTDQKGMTDKTDEMHIVNDEGPKYPSPERPRWGSEGDCCGFFGSTDDVRPIDEYGPNDRTPERGGCSSSSSEADWNGLVGATEVIYGDDEGHQELWHGRDGECGVADCDVYIDAVQVLPTDEEGAENHSSLRGGRAGDCRIGTDRYGFSVDASEIFHRDEEDLSGQTGSTASAPEVHDPQPFSSQDLRDTSDVPVIFDYFDLVTYDDDHMPDLCPAVLGQEVGQNGSNLAIGEIRPAYENFRGPTQPIPQYDKGPEYLLPGRSGRVGDCHSGTNRYGFGVEVFHRDQEGQDLSFLTGSKMSAHDPHDPQPSAKQYLRDDWEIPVNDLVTYDVDDDLPYLDAPVGGPEDVPSGSPLLKRSRHESIDIGYMHPLYDKFLGIPRYVRALETSSADISSGLDDNAGARWATKRTDPLIAECDNVLAPVDDAVSAVEVDLICDDALANSSSIRDPVLD